MMGNSLNNWKRTWAIWSAFQGRKVVLPYFPARLWVETTSHCNLRCPLCPNRDLPAKNRGFLSFELFESVVDQAAGRVRDFYLFHRGEPLLHPRLPEMVAYAENRGIATRLHTNATLLTPALGERLLDSGLSLLSFSLDGSDEETYERQRPPARFLETLRGIEQFLILKRRRKPNKITTVLQMMEIPEGRRDPDREKFTRRLRALGLDRVVWRRPHNWGGLVAPAGSGTPPRPSPLNRCTFPWYALVVYWDGTVGPCPQDFRGTMIVGRLPDRKLTEIWNGPEMTAIRRRLAQKNYGDLPVCAQCDRPRRPQLAGVPLEYAWTFLRDQFQRRK